MKTASEKGEREGKPSASSAPRWVPCTASHLFEYSQPAEGDKACTRRGHNIHKALETSSFDHLSHSDRICADRIAYHEGSLVDRYNLEGADIIREERLWSGGRTFSGRIDVIHFTPQRALVINYKTGFYEQEEIGRDWQCAAEASVVYTNLAPQSVVVAKIHPNVHPGCQYRFCNETTLQKLTKRLQQSAVAAMNKRASKFTPGPHCQWCLGRKYGTCMAFIEWKEEHGNND